MDGDGDGRGAPVDAGEGAGVAADCANDGDERKALDPHDPTPSAASKPRIPIAAENGRSATDVPAVGSLDLPARVERTLPVLVNLRSILRQLQQRSDGNVNRKS